MDMPHMPAASLPGPRLRIGRHRVRNAPLRLVTESELEGACRGWDGGTVFELANGEVWQQSSFRSRMLYLNCPAVRVWRLGHYFWLELEGAAEILPVKPIEQLEY